ncbi:MAG: RNase adaptor protein RapZ, partial [Alphaproteobacteria bacterium]
MNTRPILFITGLSGAGISTSLKALEDCGYEVFDNCPITHIEAIINEDGYKDRAVAFGLDTRARAFGADTIETLTETLNAT